HEDFADIGQVLAAPEKLAVENKGRHPEDPNLLGSATDALDLLPTLPDEISRKTRGIGAGFRQHRVDHIGVLDVEFTLPEALEDGVMITAQDRIALTFGVEHAA